MSDQQFEFHLREYDAIRKEIAQHIKEFAAIERSVLLATGGIWTWLFVEFAKHAELPLVFRCAWFLPLLIVLFAGTRSIFLRKVMKLQGAYCKELEEKIGVTGWEHFFATNYAPWYDLFALLFWVLLLPVTIILPIVMWNR